MDDHAGLPRLFSPEPGQSLAVRVLARSGPRGWGHGGATDLLAGQRRRALDRSLHRWHLDRHRQRSRGSHVPRHVPGRPRSRHTGAAGTGSRRDLRTWRSRIHGHGARAPRALGEQATTATGIATRSPSPGSTPSAAWTSPTTAAAAPTRGRSSVRRDGVGKSVKSVRIVEESR